MKEGLRPTQHNAAEDVTTGEVSVVVVVVTVTLGVTKSLITHIRILIEQ
jgi:hypothetical protein